MYLKDTVTQFGEVVGAGLLFGIILGEEGLGFGTLFAADSLTEGGEMLVIIFPTLFFDYSRKKCLG